MIGKGTTSRGVVKTAGFAEGYCYFFNRQYFDSLDTWNRYEMEIANSPFSLGGHVANKKLVFFAREASRSRVIQHGRRVSAKVLKSICYGCPYVGTIISLSSGPSTIVWIRRIGWCVSICKKCAYRKWLPTFISIEFFVSHYRACQSKA